MFIESEERDAWLQLSDEALFKLCRHDFFKAQGNGGQKRNKTSNAIRLVFLPADQLTVSDCSGRSQHDNRKQALMKLRREIAIKIRSGTSQLELPLEMSVNNRQYPLWTAMMLDRLHRHGFDVKAAAQESGASPSRLLKLIARDPGLWQFMNQCREKNALLTLKTP
ncbi:MAG: peptide chain release factor-like protein [Victivallales bacterium]|nr:peptide chain release factor-like protein [Victivallales bacterium]